MTDLRPNIARRTAAEALAAFALVFAGCDAIVANAQYDDFWIYVVGPILGAAIGAFAYQLVRGDAVAVPRRLQPMSDAAAVITDIHANLPALEASLARIEELGIERIYCGGDLVGYGPHPNEVCRLIEEHGIPTIYGNYDYAIARDLEDCGCAYVDQHDRELGGDSAIHLVHGSPRKVNEYLFEEKRASLYERLAAAEDADTLVFGHTYKPWVHEYGGVLFVNCGSVGKPKDGDPRAGFAILHPGKRHPEVAIERVPYDAASVARAVAAAGLPGEYAEKLVAAA